MSCENPYANDEMSNKVNPCLMRLKTIHGSAIKRKLFSRLFQPRWFSQQGCWANPCWEQRTFVIKGFAKQTHLSPQHASRTWMHPWRPPTSAQSVDNQWLENLPTLGHPCSAWVHTQSKCDRLCFHSPTVIFTQALRKACRISVLRGFNVRLSVPYVNTLREF